MEATPGGRPGVHAACHVEEVTRNEREIAQIPVHQMVAKTVLDLPKNQDHATCNPVQQKVVLN